MKGYEDISRSKLVRRVPVIIRLDGKSFHTLTRKYFGKGFDINFLNLMQLTTQCLMNEIQGCEFAYTQSDEISLLLTDYKHVDTQGYFCYNLNKLISISAGIASAYFTSNLNLQLDNRAPLAVFDSRAFSLPQDEVCNYFIWRQQDATRNAIQMAGQEMFSQKQLHKKSCNDIQEMLFTEKGINFDSFPTVRKRGLCVVEGEMDNEIPIFTKDRNYVEKFVDIEES